MSAAKHLGGRLRRYLGACLALGFGAAWWQLAPRVAPPAPVASVPVAAPPRVARRADPPAPHRAPRDRSGRARVQRHRPAPVIERAPAREVAPEVAPEVAIEVAIEEPPAPRRRVRTRSS